MLLFISHFPCGLCILYRVSIHLMLLFIVGWIFLSERIFEVSIHLMLLFIIKVLESLIKIIGFQYISCYSLSLAVGAVVSKLMCFNTSHVTLYRYTLPPGTLWQRFQYISCYSLSLVFPIFSLLTFFIISQNTRVCNIFPKQHRLFESFHRSTPKPYIFTTFHIFL